MAMNNKCGAYREGQSVTRVPLGKYQPLEPEPVRRTHFAPLPTATKSEPYSSSTKRHPSCNCMTLKSPGASGNLFSRVAAIVFDLDTVRTGFLLGYPRVENRKIMKIFGQTL